MFKFQYFILNINDWMSMVTRLW